MDDIQQQREHFEKVSAGYYAARQHRNHLALKELLWRHFFTGKQDLFPEKLHVLEPMCGYSEGRQILTSHLDLEIHYTGFDFSQPLVDQARLSYPQDNIFLQDVTRWEPVEKFDLVILIGGLHHVYRHTKDVLDRIFIALKPGGYFINFEPTQNNALFRYVRNCIYRKNPLFDHDTERAFELPELNALYQETGFTIEDQVYPGLLSYVLYYNPDAFPKLNLGTERSVSMVFEAEKFLYRTAFAKFFSFATLSLLRK